MKKFFIILLLFVFNACSESSNKKYFICDSLKKVNHQGKKKFDGTLDYWDRMFTYEKKNNGEYEASFPLYGGEPVGIKFKDGLLSGVYLSQKGTQTGEYRELYNVYRFDMKKKLLIHSYAYYVSVANYNEIFNNDYVKSINNPWIFTLMDPKAPEGYKKVAWDKTKWQCYELSYMKYIMYRFSGILYLFTV